MAARRDQVCGCCGGTGEVEALDGKQRPCSRCRSADFMRWFEACRRAIRERNDQPARGGGDDGGVA